MSNIFERFGTYFLDDIVEWITSEYEIEELFTNNEIERWLSSNAYKYGYIQEEE